MGYDKEYYKRYREEHRGEIAEKNRLWRLGNPSKIKAIRRRQKENGYTDWFQKHYRTTSGSKYAQLKAHAKARGILFGIEKHEFVEWYENHPKYCSILALGMTYVQLIQTGQKKFTKMINIVLIERLRSGMKRV